jgi:hypothetical protein
VYNKRVTKRAIKDDDIGAQAVQVKDEFAYASGEQKVDAAVDVVDLTGENDYSSSANQNGLGRKRCEK